MKKPSLRRLIFAFEFCLVITFIFLCTCGSPSVHNGVWWWSHLNYDVNDNKIISHQETSELSIKSCSVDLGSPDAALRLLYVLHIGSICSAHFVDLHKSELIYVVFWGTQMQKNNKKQKKRSWAKLWKLHKSPERSNTNIINLKWKY